MYVMVRITRPTFPRGDEYALSSQVKSQIGRRGYGGGIREPRWCNGLAHWLGKEEMWVRFLLKAQYFSFSLLKFHFQTLVTTP